jgi:NTP pyrophosphatase (non-canonical NTP hydrolase)
MAEGGGMKVEIISPQDIHQLAIHKGWYNSEVPFERSIANLHGEVSEAWEAYRDRIPEGEEGCISEELADIVIRVFDTACNLGIDILRAIEKKHEYNKTRPYRHGGKLA